MLDFSEDFFVAEKRCDFLVDVTMKTVWAAELEVLCEIAKVCEKHNITWYMAYGSLLGAVRHEGFIPWDDDIDIWLFRKDYQRLLEVMQDELPKGYVVRSPLLKNGYPEYHSFVANSDSISIEPEHLRQFHGCPFVVGVDIYPIDDLPINEKIIARKERAFQLIRKAVQLVKRENDLEMLRMVADELKNSFNLHLFSGEAYLPKTEYEANDMSSHFWRLGNEIAMNLEDEKASDNVSVFISYVKRKGQYKREWFRECEELTFEGFGVPVPKEYDKILQADYGDYHVFKQAVAGHDYPFYKKQLEELRKRVREVERA